MPFNPAQKDRNRSGGDPAQFNEIARELLDQNTQQGSGKQVKDTASFASAGNPKAFREMAAQLRRLSN